MPRAPAKPDPERQLMIKTKACQRLLKEVGYYKKEVKENEAKLQSMKDEQRDPHDIKKFEEVLGESYMMVPDSETRLRKSLEDLMQFMQSDEYTQRQQQSQTSEWESTAREMLKQQHTGSNDGGKNADSCDVQETDVTDLKDDEAF
ncbi:Tubulin binding cofactor A [Seminavis robusta]|uniref:Tubulin-specific chaperone A n=1 Tax=Seminavis robusta TaxID=568900 RepID=A0A9N8DIS4_9STRA|nr:Tubulin binding cofactor A [Seminavis robusta]|eukprot:Sro110_g055070.1 Tubulin binding cofactor A (146) ;mRNA; f:102280-102813